MWVGGWRHGGREGGRGMKDAVVMGRATEEEIICFLLLPSFLPSFDGFLTLLLTFAVRPSVRASFAGMLELEMLECEMPFAVLVRSAPESVSQWGVDMERRPQWVATVE